MLPYPQVKTLLIEAVRRIRAFEAQLAAAHGHPHFDFGCRRKVYGARGELPSSDGVLHYFFHGAGCTVTQNHVVLDYDYAGSAPPPENWPLCFSAWKFARTVLTLSGDLSGAQPTREAVVLAHQWLHRLVDDGWITGVPAPPDMPFKFRALSVNDEVLLRGGENP